MDSQTAPSEFPNTAERHRLTGDDVMAQVKQLAHEGNVRRVVIKNSEGHTIVEFPLTVGVIVTVLLPVWVAVGAVVALATGCSIEVEKRT